MSVTGSLNTVEAGSDTLAASGSPTVSAGLDAQAAGDDLFAASVSAAISATISAQEQGQDGFSAAFYADVAGSLASQEQGQDGFFQIYFSVELTNADTDTLVGLFENVYDLEYVASGLDSGVNYTWRIKAHRDSNDGVVYESDWSQEMSFFTGDILATLAAVESENDIYVNWRIFHLIAQDVGEDALSAGASVAVEGVLAASEEGSDLTPRRVSISVEESGADLLSAEMYRTPPVGAAYRARYNPLANVHDFPTALSESVSSGYAAHYDIRMYDKVGGAQVFGGANYIATAHTVDMDPGTVQVRQSFDFARAGSSAVQRPMTYSLSGTAPILQSISFVQPTNFFATRTYHAVLSSGLEQSVARAHHYAVAAQLSVDRQYLVALGTEATTRVGRSHTAAYAFSEAVAVLYHVPVISADSVSGPHIIATAAASRHTVARIYRATYSLQIGEAVIERVDWQVL